MDDLGFRRISDLESVMESMEKESKIIEKESKQQMSQPKTRSLEKSTDNSTDKFPDKFTEKATYDGTDNGLQVENERLKVGILDNDNSKWKTQTFSKFSFWSSKLC